MLERLLDVADGARFSDLERWRKGPAEPSGRDLVRALTRVSEIMAVGLGAMELDTVVPHRRLVDLARYGMEAKAPQLRRHPRSRRLATLAATVVYLEAKSIDDCLELFDLLMMTELLGKAEREATKEKVRVGTSPPRALHAVPRWFRHTHASALLLAGVPVHVVSRRLGHRDVQTTLNRYAHVTDDAELRALADWRQLAAGWGTSSGENSDRED